MLRFQMIFELYWSFETKKRNITRFWLPFKMANYRFIIGQK